MWKYSTLLNRIPSYPAFASSKLSLLIILTKITTATIITVTTDQRWPTGSNGLRNRAAAPKSGKPANFWLFIGLNLSLSSTLLYICKEDQGKPVYNLFQRKECMFSQCGEVSFDSYLYLHLYCLWHLYLYFCRQMQIQMCVPAAVILQEMGNVPKEIAFA